VALGLVLERGLADVTVEDIAEAAGISPRTLFNYFPSKRSAVIAGPEPPSAEAVERFVADRTRPVLDGLQTLLAESVADWSEVLRRRQAVRTYPELIPVLHERVATFEAVLVDAVARRLSVGPDDPRAQIAGAVAAAVLRTCVTRPTGDSDASFRADLGRAFAALRDLVNA
jgi:AcrR family transcriptional regulator